MTENGQRDAPPAFNDQAIIELSMVASAAEPR
jgi:hypothetical protein